MLVTSLFGLGDLTESLIKTTISINLSCHNKLIHRPRMAKTKNMKKNYHNNLILNLNQTKCYGGKNIPSVSQSPFYSFHPINESPLCQVCIWWSRVYAWISDGLVPGLSKTFKINKYKNVNSFIIWLFFIRKKKNLIHSERVFHNACCNNVYCHFMNLEKI